MRIPIDVPLGQGFGVNPDTYRGLGMPGHNGWDFPANTGHDVYAPEAGVISAGEDASGYGHFLKLQGDSGWQHIFGHLLNYVVSAGRVSEGQLIAHVDSTGFSTGPHLHWGTRPPGQTNFSGQNFYGYVNPQQFLNQGGSVAQDQTSQIVDLRNRLTSTQVQVEQLAGQVAEIKADRDRYAEDWAHLAYLVYLGREASRDEARSRLSEPWEQARNDIANSPEAKAPKPNPLQRFKDALINFINNFK